MVTQSRWYMVLTRLWRKQEETVTMMMNVQPNWDISQLLVTSKCSILTFMVTTTTIIITIMLDLVSCHQLSIIASWIEAWTSLLMCSIGVIIKVQVQLMLHLNSAWLKRRSYMKISPNSMSKCTDNWRLNTAKWIKTQPPENKKICAWLKTLKQLKSILLF